MYPQKSKSNATRGYEMRKREREIARRKAALEWQNEVFSLKEEKMEDKSVRNILIVVVAIFLIALCLGGCIFSGIGGYVFSNLPKGSVILTEPAPAVVETQVPVVETQVPVVETQVPVVETQVPVVEPAAPAATCPDTTAEAKALFGVDVQRIGTESCGWVWRGKPESHSAVCPQGYICTWDVVDDVTVVHLGINQTANIYAGTWRLINAYPAGDSVYDTCALYAKEKDFGLKEVPSFEVRFQSVPGVGPTSCP